MQQLKHLISLLLLSMLLNGFTSTNEPELISVLIFGDSITAGYGVGKSEAFPAVLDSIAAAQGYNHVEFINGGLSGETSAGGLRRIDWMLRNPVDVFVLELGGNDGLRGLNLEQTRKNLNAIIEKVKQKNPEATIVIAGMQVPPNLGNEYTEQFQSLYPEVAKQHNAILIPFLLQGVGGTEQFMQNDDIHPNIEGHEKIAELAWPYFEKAIRQHLKAEQ
ncbi:MAG: arylesterase [Bacteroidota bacterium]